MGEMSDLSDFDGSMIVDAVGQMAFILVWVLRVCSK